MHLFKLPLAAAIALILLNGCTQVTTPAHIAGHWECDNYKIDLTDDGHYVVYSVAGNTKYEGTFTLKPDAKGEMTEFIAVPKVYPFTEYNLIRSKPASRTLTSMSGLILHKYPGVELLQCQDPAK